MVEPVTFVKGVPPVHHNSEVVERWELVQLVTLVIRVEVVEVHEGSVWVVTLLKGVLLQNDQRKNHGESDHHLLKRIRLHVHPETWAQRALLLQDIEFD